jgi:hypothetical protein
MGEVRWRWQVGPEACAENNARERERGKDTTSERRPQTRGAAKQHRLRLIRAKPVPDLPVLDNRVRPSSPRLALLLLHLNFVLCLGTRYRRPVCSKLWLLLGLPPTTAGSFAEYARVSERIRVKFPVRLCLQLRRKSEMASSDNDTGLVIRPIEAVETGRAGSWS